jgi:hypothetical protein
LHNLGVLFVEDAEKDLLVILLGKLQDLFDQGAPLVIKDVVSLFWGLLGLSLIDKSIILPYLAHSSSVDYLFIF